MPDKDMQVSNTLNTLKRDTIIKISDLYAKILQSDIVLRFKKNHPGVFDFIVNRLSLKSFQGLPLTILIISIISNIFLLFDFTEDTINSKEFIAIDSYVAGYLYKYRSEPLAGALYFISGICDTSSVAIIGAIFCIYFLVAKKFHLAIGILISLLGSGLSIYLGKNIFEIDRPRQYAYHHENYFSFPSGHSTIAVAFYGLLFYFLLRHFTSVKARIKVFISAFIFCMLIGFSRIYLSVHYLSDVLAGYMLGLIWLLLSISIIEWQKPKRIG
jgi:membrane-associated phospholipid phosphatase